MTRASRQGWFRFLARLTVGVAVVMLLAPRLVGQAGAVTVDAPPSLLTFPDQTPLPPSWTFTAGTSSVFQVWVGGTPEPILTITGALPPGIMAGSDGLTGTPAFGSAGVYHLTFTASNAVGTVTDSLALTVVQGTIKYPTNDSSSVDTTLPFSWFQVAGAQAYDLTVGTSPGGTDVFNSGVLASRQLSVAVPAMPPYQFLYNTLYVAINGMWVVKDTTRFMADRGVATLTYPSASYPGPIDQVDTADWFGFDQAQGYLLSFGSTPFGVDLGNSGVLPPTSSSYPFPDLPPNQTIYATLYSKTSGGWTRYDAYSFTALPGKATFTYPVNGQVKVNPLKPITWAGIGFDAGGYDVTVGTKPFATNLVNSGVLPSTQTSYQIPLLPLLPAGTTLYATLYTETMGSWHRYQAITFRIG